MPELPEVETTLRAIKKFQGQNLTNIKVHNRNLRWTVAKGLEKNSRNQGGCLVVILFLLSLTLSLII